jgi:hypothetical protein
LDLEISRAAHPSDDLGKDTNREEITGYQEQSERRMQDGSRRINVDVFEISSEISDRHQDAPDQKRPSFNVTQGEIVSRKKQRLTLGVDPGPKHNPKTQDKEFDPPPHCSNRRAKRPLDIHQDQNCRKQ